MHLTPRREHTSGKASAGAEDGGAGCAGRQGRPDVIYWGALTGSCLPSFALAGAAASAKRSRAEKAPPPQGLPGFVTVSTGPGFQAALPYPSLVPPLYVLLSLARWL